MCAQLVNECVLSSVLAASIAEVRLSLQIMVVNDVKHCLVSRTYEVATTCTALDLS